MVVALNVLDILTTIIFSVESFLKILTFGFVLNGRSSYLRNPWNAMDFVIIVLSIISLTPLPNSLNIVKVLRVLRPLRLISRNKRLKVAVKALGQALPNIANISIISLLFFLIFGIIGVNYFKGALFICNHHRFDNLPLVTKWDCLNGGGDWLDNSFSYNNIVDSI